MKKIAMIISVLFAMTVASTYAQSQFITPGQMEQLEEIKDQQKPSAPASVGQAPYFLKAKLEYNRVVKICNDFLFAVSRTDNFEEPDVFWDLYNEDPEEFSHLHYTYRGFGHLMWNFEEEVGNALIASLKLSQQTVVSAESILAIIDDVYEVNVKLPFVLTSQIKDAINELHSLDEQYQTLLARVPQMTKEELEDLKDTCNGNTVEEAVSNLKEGLKDLNSSINQLKVIDESITNSGVISDSLQDELNAGIQAIIEALEKAAELAVE